MSLKYKALVKNTVVNDADAYDIVRSPVITEKATLNGQYNQVTFRVAVGATKPQIKQAIEKIFKVKVNAVNTLNQQGKAKRFRGIIGKRADYKKAVVSLAEGHSIDMSAGV